MQPLSDIEKDHIKQWAAQQGKAVTLRYATANHPMDEPIKAFAQQIGELSPHVKLKKDGDAVIDRPSLFVGPHTAYQALPSKRELAPFLTALGDARAFVDGLSKDVCEHLERLEVPAMVKVYITPHCPFCPTVVSLLLGMAAFSDRVRLSIIDGEMFVDAAQADRVSAAPTIILDNQFRWTGSVDALELVTMMLDRDPAGLGADALRGLIEDGDAEQVARMMADGGKLFPAFFELLTHPRWSVRLGAMVAFESLVELDPQLAGQVVEPLITRFGDVDNMVKGDLLHVLGESGNASALSFLRTIPGHIDDEEVKAAAEEAIEKLK